MKEYYYDKQLNIQTRGKNFLQEKNDYYPYEPTPYYSLEVLFQHYPVNRMDSFVDFGCGMGRLNFFLHYFYHVSVTGIEMDQKFFQQALHNREAYKKVNKKSLENLHLLHGLAETYRINCHDNRFYFFNPFSIHIFSKVIQNILRSYEEHQRAIELILYYPSQDYIFFLESKTIFAKKQEIIVPGLYEKDDSERFLIYGFPNEII